MAVEGMHEHAARAAPPVVADLVEPFHQHARLARAALGKQRENTGRAAVPGSVEGFQIGLAPGEAFPVGR